MLSLPVELIIKILAVLDLRSLLRCRQVCSLLDGLVRNDASLQYKIELTVAGMEDGSSSPLLVVERLHKLKLRQDAWNRMRFTSETAVPMRRGGVWELYGGVLAQSRDDHGLSFRQLPSDIRGIDDVGWTLEDLPMRIRDFSLDPSQELLVVIEKPRQINTSTYLVHLLDLHTGKVHKNAPTQGYLSHCPDGQSFSYMIQTCGEHLGVLFLSEDETVKELVIWKWRTGALELVITGAAIGAFVFLSDTQILVSHLGGLNDDSEVEPVLGVIDFTEASNVRTPIKDIGFLCLFRFPLMRSWAAPLAVHLRSDPAPSWKPHPDLQVPFHVAREDRLYVVTAWIAEGVAVKTLVLFLPSQTIFKHLKALTPEEKGRCLNWDEWGPTGSRLLTAPFNHSATWVCYVHGMAFASVWRSPMVGDERYLQIYDFNPLAVKKFRADLKEGGDYKEDEEDPRITTVIIDEPAHLPSAANLFINPVVTTLPFLWKKFPVDDTRFVAVMLSEDSVIMVSSQPRIRQYRVLTLEPGPQ
ncbi:hypothetical protein C8Q75DRAFT_768748 [Abortiporus biennis]|nr:hypothetical protein C8Q75DRAFT_768748 [Abortiporus biennis]